MKKWHSVLWVVFASLALSGVAIIFRGGTSLDEMKVATVNGRGISMKSYKGALAQVQERLAGVREYARMLGISEEILLANFFGSSSPYEIALDNSIKESLLDEVGKPLSLNIASDDFNEEFVKTLPRGFINEQGRINLDSYNLYINRLGLKPSEYEQLREQEFKRQIVDRCIANAFYAPEYLVRAQFAQDHGKKSFSVIEFSLKDTINEIKSNVPTDEKLKEFYQRHRERWIVPEKRKALSWTISAQEYGKTIEIDQQSVERFYERNKSSKYRIPPKIQVRHILINKVDNSEAAFKKAQEIHEKIKQNPISFEKLAREHSADEKSAKNGGLTEFFTRGTYDQDFEKAAFRLQNKGDLSNIVKTTQGFEIIQLHDRINASTKSLEDVQDEIIDSLRAKRSITDLKSALESFMRSGKEERADFEACAQNLNFKQQKNDWLTQESAQATDAQGQLAKRIFSSQGKTSQRGFYFEDGIFTLYFKTDAQPSFVPKLEEIKEKVLDYYFKSEAKARIKKIMSDIRSEIMNKKSTLQELAQKYGKKIVETDMLSKNDTIKAFSHASKLVKKLFELTHQSQLLSYKDGKGYFVGRLKDTDPINEKAFQEKKTAIREQEKNRSRQEFVRTFIASLQRNAKIDVDKGIVKNYVGR